MDLGSIREKTSHQNKRKRVGRGPGSGRGKTSTRGHKGHQARSGWSRRRTFEGGQIPLFRKVPVKGFSNGRFKVSYFVINVGQLNIFDEGATVDVEALKQMGLASINKKTRIKILGNGECQKQLNLKVHAISKSADEKIKQKNGTVELIS